MTRQTKQQQTKQQQVKQQQTKQQQRQQQLAIVFLAHRGVSQARAWMVWRSKWEKNDQFPIEFYVHCPSDTDRLSSPDFCANHRCDIHFGETQWWTPSLVYETLKTMDYVYTVSMRRNLPILKLYFISGTDIPTKPPSAYFDQKEYFIRMQWFCLSGEHIEHIVLQMRQEDMRLRLRQMSILFFRTSLPADKGIQPPDESFLPDLFPYLITDDKESPFEYEKNLWVNFQSPIEWRSLYGLRLCTMKYRGAFYSTIYFLKYLLLDVRLNRKHILFFRKVMNSVVLEDDFLTLLYSESIDKLTIRKALQALPHDLRFLTNEDPEFIEEIELPDETYLTKLARGEFPWKKISNLKSAHIPFFFDLKHSLQILSQLQESRRQGYIRRIQSDNWTVPKQIHRQLRQQKKRLLRPKLRNATGIEWRDQPVARYLYLRVPSDDEATWTEKLSNIPNVVRNQNLDHKGWIYFIYNY